eukprot:gene5955-biopygen5781
MMFGWVLCLPVDFQAQVDLLTKTDNLMEKHLVIDVKLKNVDDVAVFGFAVAILSHSGHQIHSLLQMRMDLSACLLRYCLNDLDSAEPDLKALQLFWHVR